MTALVALFVAWLRRRLFGWLDRVPVDTDLWAGGADAPYDEQALFDAEFAAIVRTESQRSHPSSQEP